MATPIKITPVLKGKDSIFFSKQLAKSSKRKLSAKRKAKIFSTVDAVLSNSKSLSK